MSMPTRPEGTRSDLLPPSMIDQDTQKPRSDAQKKTLYILNSGILPHGNHERDEMAELLKLARDPEGVLSHTHRIAAYHISDEHTPFTHAQLLAQQLGFYVNEELRTTKTQEVRLGVVTKKADHMLNYVEDSQDTMSSMSSLQSALNDVEDDESPINSLDNLDPVKMRALVRLTRFYEVQDYATNPQFQKSRMDALLTGQGIDGIKKFIQENMDNRSIKVVKDDIVDYLKLERGRMLFWLDHLVGHKSEAASLGRLAVRPRIGLVDSKKYDVKDRIWKTLERIASRIT